MNCVKRINMRITFAAIAALTFILLAPAPARAQWTTPDASGNVSSTNTGNIGIGTTTPAGKLDVSDDLRVGAGRLKFTFSGPEGLVQGGIERLGFSTPNAGNSAQLTRMRLGGLAANSTIEFLNVSSVFLSSTSAKFGLGTSNPTSKFHLVSGTDNGTTMLHMDTGVHGGTTFAVGGTANNESTLDMSVYRAGQYVSRFGVSNYGQVYLQPGGGNVGIGTTNPDTYSDGSVANYLALQAAGTNQHAQIAVAGTGTGNGQIVFGNSSVRRAVIAGVDGSHLLFYVNNANSGVAALEAMRITSGGNIGVGTMSPQDRLHVKGSLRVQGNNVNGDITLMSADGTTGKWDFFTLGSNGSMGFYDIVSGTIPVTVEKAAPSNMLYVTASGRLGVGNAAPSYKLDVSGQIRSSSGGFVFPDGTTQSTAASQNIFKSVGNAAGAAQFSAGSNADTLSFEGTGGTTVSFDAANRKVVINSSSSGSSGWTDSGSSVSVTNGAARVGLGTSGPTAGLDVQTPVSGATANGVRLQQTLTPVNNNGTLNALYINPTFNDGVAVGNVHNALVTGAGNVGLGTTATAAGLDVQNVGVVSGSTTYGARFKQTIPSANNYTDSTAFMIDPTFSDGAAVGVRHNGLVVTSGNVGIGTSTPASQLTVNLSNTDYVNAGGANSHVLMTNPSATGQNVFSSVINGSVVAKWRTDYLGNISSVAGGAGEHHFWTGGDYGVGQIRMSIKNDGRVGIGTTTPGAKLSLTTTALNDGLMLNGSANWALLVANLGDGSYNNMSRAGDRGIIYGGAAAGSPGGGFVIAPWASATSGMRIDPAGNVGIGNPNPRAKLEVWGGSDTALLIGDRGAGGKVGLQFLGSGVSHAGITFDGNGLTVENASNTHTPSNWHPAGTPMNFTVRTGKLGVNTGDALPSHTLEVNGTINASGEITGQTINAVYQDVAEWVPSSQKLSAGTVVVLDKSEKNHVLASSVSYDTKVAGVVSAEPGVILGVGGEGKLKVATTGRVKVKVDAARGSIEVGDLLVTSDTQGVAMKSVEVDLGGVKIHRPGTIIGKALEPLASGTGEILVLLSLQ